MPRRSLPLGPETLGLIEDARIDLLQAVLAVREGDNEPVIALPEDVPDLNDEDAVHAYRQKVTDVLSEFDPDELRPAERRSRRIRAFANGKGVTSLTTIVDQRLDDDRAREFERQPDALCRAIWAFLNARETFEDAESFHFARQFRDYGRLYDAFEVELENAVALDAASIDEASLAAKVTAALELKTACTVRALDLPATDTHPASIMLIVRHGGPLSSVYDHRDDGRRGTIYYRPPNEATLIYTPSKQQIEVCANSPLVRQKVSDSFAEVALNHDISQKPLTWKRYNLTRFRTSLSLPIPSIDGYIISLARVLEAEIRLGKWSRKLSLKVAIDDDIEEVAALYLKPNNIFKRADSFSRIGIAVAYSRVGDEKERTLNITISGSKSCNLQSNKDPDERSLGYALLGVWGILSAFRQIENGDLRAMFPQLVALYDRVEDEVSGAYLRELGLDPARLIEGGLLERRGRQDIVLVDDDGMDGEFTVKPSPTPGMVRTVGPFGEDGGERPASDLERYEINRQWLHETVVRLMNPLLAKRASQILGPDLTLLGAMQIDGADVPVYYARRLDDLKTIGQLDLALRARNDAGVGIVLAASAEMPACLGPNVVVSLLSNVSSEGDEFVLSRDSLELAFRSGRTLALGGTTPQVLKSGNQSATLFIPGRPSLAILGANQIKIFERLVAAYKAGSPDVKASALTEDLDVRSPQQAFRKETWQSILNVYIGKGAKHGFWRLVVDAPPSEAPV